MPEVIRSSSGRGCRSRSCCSGGLPPARAAASPWSAAGCSCRRPGSPTTWRASSSPTGSCPPACPRTTGPPRPGSSAWPCSSGVMAFDPKAWLRFRPSFFDLPMLGWCLVPLASGLANGVSPVETIGERGLSGAGLGRPLPGRAGSISRTRRGWTCPGRGDRGGGAGVPAPLRLRVRERRRRCMRAPATASTPTGPRGWSATSDTGRSSSSRTATSWGPGWRPPPWRPGGSGGRGISGGSGGCRAGWSRRPWWLQAMAWRSRPGRSSCCSPGSP